MQASSCPVLSFSSSSSFPSYFSAFLFFLKNFLFLPHWLNYKCTAVVSRTTRKSWCHCPGCFPHTGWSSCAGPRAYNRSLHGDFVFTAVLIQLPGSQMADIFSLASSSRHKRLWVFHVTGLMGGVSYLSQTRQVLLFQAEFVLYLTGTSCTVEQTASTEQLFSI